MSEENSKNSLPVTQESRDLTEQQAAFAREYLVDFNATQAAIRAGYSEKTARSIGSENLTKPAIATRVRALITERAERLGINADDILLRALKLYDICTKAEPVMAWDYDAGELRETGEYTIDSKGAAKALEIVGKLLGCFMRDKGDDGGGKQAFVMHIHTGTKEPRTIEGTARTGNGMPVINVNVKDSE